MQSGRSGFSLIASAYLPKGYIIAEVGCGDGSITALCRGWVLVVARADAGKGPNQRAFFASLPSGFLCPELLTTVILNVWWTTHRDQARQASHRSLPGRQLSTRFGIVASLAEVS